MFSGSIVAAITPFNKGKVDIAAFIEILEHLITKASGAIVVAGSTGEGTALTSSEREELLKTAVKVSAGRVPIIAGCSALSTQDSIELITQSELAGCSAVLVIPPAYVKPTQAGIIQHFQTIYDHTHIPVLVYTNPGRTGVDITVETMLELAKIPTVVGVKDSHPDIARIAQIRLGVESLKASGKIPATKPFSILSGDSITFAAALVMGADGCISITANPYPDLSAALYSAWTKQDLPEFFKIRDMLIPMDAALICESNPIPVKYAMHKLGFCQNELRLPLLPATKASEVLIDKAITTLSPLQSKAA